MFRSNLPCSCPGYWQTTDERSAPGAGPGALTCWKQAVFALARVRDRPDIRRLGQGSGISQATACRYKDEAIEVLAAKAPTLRQALDKAVDQGLPYLIPDGTLFSSDRCVRFVK
ncbi:MAG TPA: hypothetical protein VIY52_18015 [Streptosporangiaceae bacterium]